MSTTKWRLFIHSSTLKVCSSSQWYSNEYGLLPIGHSADMKDTYDDIKSFATLKVEGAELKHMCWYEGGQLSSGTKNKENSRSSEIILRELTFQNAIYR